MGSGSDLPERPNTPGTPNTNAPIEQTTDGPFAAPGTDGIQNPTGHSRDRAGGPIRGSCQGARPAGFKSNKINGRQRRPVFPDLPLPHGKGGRPFISPTVPWRPGRFWAGRFGQTSEFTKAIQGTAFPVPVSLVRLLLLRARLGRSGPIRCGRGARHRRTS